MIIRVIIADDENLIRRLFITSLSQYEDIEIVGQAGNGTEVLNLVKTLNPHVLLLDLNMPGLSGIEVLHSIQVESIPVKTIVVSMQDDDPLIWETINAGALGFLSKNEDWEELHLAVKMAAKGQFYNTNRVNLVLLEMARRQKNAENNKSLDSFTKRELDVIKYLNEGLSSNEIGGKLFCSRANVDRIRQELIHRVGAKNTIGLLSYAAKHKLIY